MPLFSGRCYSNTRLEGKTAIVTGCNTGIGKETVLDFYKRGAHIVMACRNTTKANEARVDILKKCEDQNSSGSIVITKLDLNSLDSVRQCAKYILDTEPEIHLLVNNAGVMMCPKGTTEDGFETQFGTNHLAHFLFTILLLPRIIKSKPARIVNVSSKGHEYGSVDFEDLFFEKRRYSSILAYSQSKLANILFSKELANKLKANNITCVNVYSLHPGTVATELGRHLDSTYFPGLQFLLTPLKLFIKSPELGAQTTIYCAVDEKCAEETGLYYSDCVPKEASKNGRDPAAAEKLWDVSWKLVKLDNNWNPFTARDGDSEQTAS